MFNDKFQVNQSGSSLIDKNQNKKKKLSRRELFRNLFSIRSESLEGEVSGIDPDMIYADRLMKKRDYQRALEYYTLRLEKEPGHLEAMRNLGYCRFKLGEPEKAIEAFEKVLSLRPGDNVALLYLGLINAYRGNGEEAVRHWKSYFNIHKPLIQREINLILARHERGDRLDPQEMADMVARAMEKQKSR